MRTMGHWHLIIHMRQHAERDTNDASPLLLWRLYVLVRAMRYVLLTTSHPPGPPLQGL